MPRDLPGMYWDEVRGRYFPISARPAHIPPGEAPQRNTDRNFQSTTSPVTRTTFDDAELHERPPKRRRLDSVAFMGPSARYRSSIRFAELSRYSHDLISRNISSLSEGEVVSHGDLPFSSLNVIAETCDSFVACTGDTGGWLQTYKVDSRGNSRSYSRELYLGSMVSAVCRSPTHRLAVSFGPSCKIAVENVAQDAELWTIMSMPTKCYDVRTAHLSGNSLALGAARKGILFPNIDADWHYEVLPTGSDVFSITQHGHLIYTGTRSGSIKVFDKRVNAYHKGEELLGSRYTDTARTVTHLSVLHDWQLLVSTIAGDIELHDLRFARESTPFMQLRGHVNNYIADIGFAVSPCNSYVFAAGQDRRIRAWSLRSGELLSPAPPQKKMHDDQFSELFHQHFADPVVAMQITESSGTDGGLNGDNGLSLWALSGKKLYRYSLGRRLQHF